MKNYWLLLTAALALLLTGCGGVIVKADKEHERQAKTFSSKEKQSNIYFYMEPVFMGSYQVLLNIDGQAAGEMELGSFFLLEVPPGRHTMFTKVTSNAGGGESPIIEVDTEAGRNYFIEQPTGLQIYAPRLVDEKTGKVAIERLSMVALPESVVRQIAAKAAAEEKILKEAAIQRNFASPDKIAAPQPIAGNGGKYMSPFTATGAVALWAQKPVAATDNGSDLAANVGGAVGSHIGNKVLENIPFGLGGMIGRSAGEEAARAATRKKIEPELPGLDVVRAGSDISFNTAEELAVYMYAKNSAHGQYARVLALTQRVYPELQDVYTPAIAKASQLPQKVGVQEKLEELKNLKEKGLITEAEFKSKRKKILEAI